MLTRLMLQTLWCSLTLAFLTSCASNASLLQNAAKVEGEYSAPANGYDRSLQILKLQVFFGLSKPDGGVVTNTDWNKFREELISPKFRKGYTIFKADGYYQGTSEQSKVLTLLVKASDLDESLKKIKTISNAYIARFNQESVMLIKVPVLSWEFYEKQ